MPFVLIVAIVLAAATALFAVQNSDVITVSFLGWQWDASLALILILTLGVGILVGYLSGLPSSLRKSRQLRQVKRDLGELETTAAQLEGEDTQLSPPLEVEEDR